MEGQSKQERKILNRYRAYIPFFALILLPSLSLVASYPTRYFLAQLFLVSLLSCVACAFFLKKWERKMQKSVSTLVKAKLKQYAIDSEQKGIILTEEIEKKEKQFQKIFEETKRSYEHQIDLFRSSAWKAKEKSEEIAIELREKSHELEQLRKMLEEMRFVFKEEKEGGEKAAQEWQESIQKKEVLLEEYRKTIMQQREVIEKKQKYISKLEIKVKDLMYEIRSLLLIEEPEEIVFSQRGFITVEPPRVEHSDAATQLNRYLNTVQNFTGADHLASLNGRLPKYNLSYEDFAIDQRRLFELFREESAAIVFVYSLPDSKFLFTNHLVKSFLGWSVEKFTKDFPSLVGSGYSEWRKALYQLNTLKESDVKISIKSRQGDEILFNCLMGLVTKGPFSNHVIGILTPVHP